MIAALILMAITLLVMMLLPTVQKSQGQRLNTIKQELLEERDVLVQQLKDAGEDGKEALRTEVQLARVLTQLENLPETSDHTLLKPAFNGAFLLLVAVIGVMLLGSYTVFPQWRYGGLGKAEAEQLSNVLNLPNLRETALKQQTPESYQAWGNAAFNASQLAEAAEAYSQILKQNPKNPEALRRFGIYLVQQKGYEQQGITFLQAAIKLDPQNSEGYLLLGYGYRNVGQAKEALAAFLTYREVNPSSPDADDMISTLKAELRGNFTGAELFAQNCAACHGKAGEGRTAPALTYSPALKDAEALKTIIAKGMGTMPGFNFGDQDLTALVDYVQGLK